MSDELIQVCFRGVLPLDAQMDGRLLWRFFMEEMIRVLTLIILLLQLAVILRMN